ncbi:MAG: VanZ family protein [Bacilli bacterium]|nr:VanZ family protein [Bacilli bacterium]
MDKYLTDTILGVIDVTFPMVIISVVVAILLRISYLIKNKIHFTLHKELFMLAFIIYILCLFQVVTLQDTVSWSTNNFIPFKEILRYDIGSNLFLKNVIGNVLLFIPFGYFISYILKVEKVYLPILIIFITSIAIELVQLYIGRVFDVDDVILNLIGGIIGYILYKIVTGIGKKFKIFDNEIVLDILSLLLLGIVIYIFIIML